MLGLSNNLASGGFVDTFANLKSLSFDGSDEYLDCGASSVLDFSNGDFSVGCWLKSTTSSRETVVSKYVTASPDGWYIDILATGYAQVGFHEDATTYILRPSSSIVNDGSWHHIVLVYDSGTVNCYKDGSLNNGTAVTNNSATDSDSSSSLNIGKIGYSGSGYFSGSVDEVKVYNRALSLPEVLKNYKHGLSKHS